MTATMIDAGVRWRFHSHCPPDWASRIDQCGGGFFHSPAGLIASGEVGDAFFGELVDGDEVIGIAAGVQRRCRVPPRPRHACLPSPPALAPGARELRARALELLVEGGREAGWTDLTVHSFEAEDPAPPGPTGIRLPPRLEYDIPLSGSSDALRHRLSSHHRRRLPVDDVTWSLRTLAGRDARALLVDVTRSAVRRAAARRGTGFEVTLPPAEAFREDPAWGLTTYAATQTDGDRLLSAALVGWAGTRAYYVSGGSTSEGYASDASIWLHLQIARVFQSAGFTHYCLGGAPAGAASPSDPSHGLHRFKTGFGATVRSCAGVRWVFGAEHEAGHRFTRWIRQRFTLSKETV